MRVDSLFTQLLACNKIIIVPVFSMVLTIDPIGEQIYIPPNASAVPEGKKLITVWIKNKIHATG